MRALLAVGLLALQATSAAATVVLVEVSPTIAGRWQPITIAVELLLDPARSPAWALERLRESRIREQLQDHVEWLSEQVPTPEQALLLPHGVRRLRALYRVRTGKPGWLRLPPLRLSPALQAEPIALPAVLVYTYRPELAQSLSATFALVAERRTGFRPQLRVLQYGSAFLLRPDVLVTSFHVLVGAEQARVRLDETRELVLDRAWWADPQNDVVLLYVPPQQWHRLGLNPPVLSVRPAPPEPDMPVFASGWPGGVFTTTTGLWESALHMPGRAPQHVSTNAVFPGLSGGVLVDSLGRGIGMIISGQGDRRAASPRSGPQANVCVAVDLRWIEQVLERLSTPPRPLRTLVGERIIRENPYALAMTLERWAEAFAQLAPREQEAQMARLGRLLARDTADAGLWYLVGSALLRLGRRAEAEAALRRALQLFPEHFAARYGLAVLYLTQRRPQEARMLWQELLRYRSLRTLAAYGLARSYLGEGRYERALLLLQELVRGQPEFAAGVFWLAYCELMQERPDMALLWEAWLAYLEPLWARQLALIRTTPLLHPMRPLELPLVALY